MHKKKTKQEIFALGEAMSTLKKPNKVQKNENNKNNFVKGRLYQIISSLEATI